MTERTRVASPPADRYHALDALRGFAMLLGVLLHAAIPYLHNRVPFWPVRDARRSVAFDIVLLAIHDFRMQVFFLLAGFFGALLYARHGPGRTAVHRLKRVALPLALAMVTIQPALQAVAVHAVAAAHQADPGEAPDNEAVGDVLAAAETPAGVVGHYFASGQFLRNMVPVHLWFLWYLLLCFAVMLPLARVADRVVRRAPARAWDAAARRLFQSRWRWLVLAALTWPLLLVMDMPAGPDTPLGWVPVWHLLAYYFLFFLIGWTLYRHRDLFGYFAAGWRTSLLVANVIVLPTGLVLFDQLGKQAETEPDGAVPARYALSAALGLYTWLMVGGLVGLFARFLWAERAWVRWLADSAYWCYLASLPPVVLFQFLAAACDVPAVVKFLTVSTATLATVLVSYRLFVRYMWLGRLLNGPRARPTNRDTAGSIVLAPAEAP